MPKSTPEHEIQPPLNAGTGDAVQHTDAKAAQQPAAPSSPAIHNSVVDAVKNFQQHQVKWDKREAHTDDPLANCLEIISNLLERPMSAAAFKAGLPLDNNRMDPSHFVRAARRAGIAARIMHKKLNHISELTLPCVLLLEGDKACILTKIDDTGQFEIIMPETGRGKLQLSADALSDLYSGYAIFTSLQYEYDQRSTDLEIEKPQAWFWGVMAKFWPIYGKVALAALFVNIFAMVTPLYTMNVYDRVVPNNSIDTLIVLSIGIGLVLVFDFILKNLRVHFVDEAGKNADIMLGSRLFEHVMNLNLAARPSSSGAFANQLREYESLREFFSSATLVTLIDLPFIFLFIGVIALIGGNLAWISLAAIPLIIIGSMIFHRPLQAWVQRSFREATQKHALLVEAINGIETIKSFTAEGQVQRQWERFLAQTADSSKYLHFFSSLALNWSGLIQQGAYIAVVIWGVCMIGETKLSMGGLIAASILTSRALAPLSQVVALLVRLNQSRTSLKSLNDIMELPVDRPRDVRFLNRPTLKGEVEFKDVSFSYPQQKVQTFNNFNLKIKAGEKVGILGRIGSGKTTLERLLLNLYPVNEGAIKVDGTDIRQIDPADIRHNIGYVPQDIYLFYGSVRDNIVFGARDVDESAIMQAAEISGVMDFIKAHPQGFDLPVGEGGSTLSGGQRQSIAIARALVRSPSLYLLDEPTAMMDHTSEGRFINRFEKILEDKTLILITHRTSLLHMVNRIIVMDAGKIVADGPRDEVIKALSHSQIRSS